MNKTLLILTPLFFSLVFSAFLNIYFSRIFSFDDANQKSIIFFSKADQAVREIEEIERLIAAYPDLIEDTFLQESLSRVTANLKNDISIIQAECPEQIGKRLEHFMIRISNDLESFMNEENSQDVRASSFLKLKSDSWKTREIIEHAVKKKEIADEIEKRKERGRLKKRFVYFQSGYLFAIAFLTLFIVLLNYRSKKQTGSDNLEQRGKGVSGTNEELKELRRQFDREQIINKRKSALLDLIPLGIFAVDTSKRITFLNRQTVEWFELKDNLIGENATSVLSVLGIQKDIEKFIFNGSVYLISSFENGDETFFIIRNVTESEEMSRKLVDSERLVSIGEMASRITHEIRNPLSTIKLNSEYLAENIDELESSQVAGSINMIVREVERLEQITGKYMDMVKYRTRAEVESHTTLPVDLFEIISFHTAEFEKRDIEIKIVNCEKMDLPITLSSFKEIILNLLKNGWEELENGGKIQVSASVDKNKAVIVVEDSGGGIPEREREQVFKNFYTKKPGGTGIGLSHSRKLAVETGGRLYAADSSLGGVAMVLELPVKKV